MAIIAWKTTFTHGTKQRIPHHIGFCATCAATM
jgi:hypothetical protein